MNQSHGRSYYQFMMASRVSQVDPSVFNSFLYSYTVVKFDDDKIWSMKEESFWKRPALVDGSAFHWVIDSYGTSRLKFFA